MERINRRKFIKRTTLALGGFSCGIGLVDMARRSSYYDNLANQVLPQAKPIEKRRFALETMEQTGDTIWFRADIIAILLGFTAMICAEPPDYWLPSR